MNEQNKQVENIKTTILNQLESELKNNSLFSNKMSIGLINELKKENIKINKIEEVLNENPENQDS